jgi:mycofactocin precursor
MRDDPQTQNPVDDPQNADPVIDGTASEEPAGDAELVEADLLVEDVSIDGMCGVY